MLKNNMMLYLKKAARIIAAIAVFVSCSSFVVSASQYVDNDKLYSNENGKKIYISSDKFLYNFDGEIPGVTLCGYTGQQNDIVIPENINGRAVSAIDENTFANDNQITSIIIPACITSIGEGSFNGCENLESVTLSGSAQILEGVFCDCSKLKSIVFPYGITEINNGFKNCTALQSVKFSRSISKLGDGSFNGCSSLEQIEWSTGLSYLGDVFDGCEKVSTIHIPKGIVIIDGAFDNCSSAETLELPDSLLYINSGFSGCSELKKVSFPEGLLYIGKAFGNCTALTELNLSAETQIDDKAFADCPNVSIKQGGGIARTVAIIIAATLFIVCIGYTLWKSMKKQSSVKKGAVK